MKIKILICVLLLAMSGGAVAQCQLNEREQGILRVLMLDDLTVYMRGGKSRFDYHGNYVDALKAHTRGLTRTLSASNLTEEQLMIIGTVKAISAQSGSRICARDDKGCNEFIQRIRAEFSKEELIEMVLAEINKLKRLCR